ncbi:MAG TPA: exodeoxyribonuclease III [Syntrophales bacterium]|nr:exodeoxyribonuclease III [Syntrophales bacterium]HPG71973.1 exodeoxyribonuclease III [Syntrophales bacterium]HQF76215.1 exodeoxyribonuclease III [Syntrophales bacterium]HQG84403.1 exodeoxyribonuclease III [Syntrophales bacterium]
MKTFKIASYNVNSVRSRLPVVLPWLEKNRPSVLCLQETKTEDTKFPAKEFEESGWNVVFRGGKGYNGVAIVSAEKADRVALGLDDGGPADEDRLIRAVFSGITVVNTYVPQGADRESPKFAYKLEWFRRLRTFFARHYKPDQMILWCGDINVAREEIDVHNPKRLLGHVDFTPEVWEGFDHVMEWGFVDVFRRHHPGKPGQYSFFDYRVPKSVERGLGWRVDHILATAPLAKKSVAAWIDLEPRKAEKPSDHTPIVAEFKL